ncbi:recombination directionality factor [Streptomyces sp. 7N604]|uniref:recombination directionality factor n=1 Tax=Streptomyces sp. 7N604 TaxID=3457415 RepID=UPI003FD3B7E9
MAEDHGWGEPVGQLRAEEVSNGRSVALPAWLLTTRSREVAEILAQLYAGKARDCRRQGVIFEILLHKDSIVVNVDSNAFMTNRMVLRDGQDCIHVCDGSKYLEPMPEVGAPCGCSADIFERKAAARSGSGPKPDARLTFRLAAVPEVGALSFASSSWEFSESLGLVSREMERVGGPVQLMLSLQEKRLATRSGLDVTFTRPAVTVVRKFPAVKGGVCLAA